MAYQGLDWHDIDGTHDVWVGGLAACVALTKSEFEELWAAHPAEFLEIVIHGRRILTPRWQQAYGRDYAYASSFQKRTTAGNEANVLSGNTLRQARGNA